MHTRKDFTKEQTSSDKKLKAIQKSVGLHDLKSTTIGGHKSLISEANFFTSGLAVQLTFKNVSGLVIEANFFSQSARIRIVATAVLIKKNF